MEEERRKKDVQVDEIDILIRNAIFFRKHILYHSNNISSHETMKSNGNFTIDTGILLYVHFYLVFHI